MAFDKEYVLNQLQERGVSQIVIWSENEMINFAKWNPGMNDLPVLIKIHAEINCLTIDYISMSAFFNPNGIAINSINEIISFTHDIPDGDYQDELDELEEKP